MDDDINVNEDKLDNLDDIIEVECETTVGTIKMKFIKKWAELGVKQFMKLLNYKGKETGKGFFDDLVMFRAIKNFLVQFG